MKNNEIARDFSLFFSQMREIVSLFERNMTTDCGETDEQTPLAQGCGRCALKFLEKFHQISFVLSQICAQMCLECGRFL